MNSQIFRSPPPKDIIIRFIESNTTQYNNYHIFSDINFKQAKWNDRIEKFIETIGGHYYKSKKKKYIEKEQNYKSFANILRQLCRFYKITFFSKIKYIKSKHITEYFIVVPPDLRLSI